MKVFPFNEYLACIRYFVPPRLSFSYLIIMTLRVTYFCVTGKETGSHRGEIICLKTKSY